MKVFGLTLTGIILSILVLVKCGSSSSSSSNPNAAAMASIAVVNPTGSSSTASASLFDKTKTVFFSAVNFTSLQYILTKIGLLSERKSMAADGTFTSCTGATGDLAEACAKPEVLLAEIATLSNDSSTTAAATELANFTTVNPYRASCYGPGLTEDTGGSVNRPSGDLGLWATDLSATDTTACAAGQLTALLAGYPSFANDVLALQAAFVTSLKLAGKSLPAIGETVTGTTDLPAITGFTPTLATITRFADTSEGKAVYYTKITGTDTGGKAFQAHVYHQPDNADNSEFRGTIKSLIPYTPSAGSGTHCGLSMIYYKAAGVFNYDLKVACNRATASTDFFAADGQVDFTKTTAFGENGHRIRASFNSATNAATMHYAWNAGQADGSARTFAIEIPAGTQGSLTGTAYFGFGADISALAASPGGSSIWGTKMYCNWLSGLSGGTSQAKVQKQTMVQDTTTGKFINSGTAKIVFAPTNTCTHGAGWTVTNAVPTTYNGARSAVASSDANYLTTYTANDISAVTVTAAGWGSTLPTN